MIFLFLSLSFFLFFLLISYRPCCDFHPISVNLLLSPSDPLWEYRNFQEYIDYLSVIYTGIAYKSPHKSNYKKIYVYI